LKIFHNAFDIKRSTYINTPQPLKDGLLRVIYMYMHFAYKIWIEAGGKSVFGIGIFQLLMLVHQTGSLNKAAESLKMSYRAAWGKVRDYEARLGIRLLEQGRHGRTGAHLTKEGERVVDQFAKVLGEMDKLVSHGPMTKLISEISTMKNSG
jgi:molybdate transport system regulatory protein